MSAIVVKTLWMYGLAIVVSLGIAAVIKLIVAALGALERKPAAATPPATTRPSVPAAAEDVVPAEHLAAIAAAIYSVIGAHRIVHIQDAHRHEGWAAEGRLAHHRSHSLDHHPRR